MSSSVLSLQQVCIWSNLVKAAMGAARGKRSRGEVAEFEAFWADNLLGLQESLLQGCYTPGSYTHFYIHEPKRRKISAAPFRDRVVHHAVCQILEPWYEKRFIGDSYANRVGKGTHRAVSRLQWFARRYCYVLRMDIIKHFPSIDHKLLLMEMGRAPMDEPLFHLCSKILASGRGVLDTEAEPNHFPGDKLQDRYRPRGLPIGNLTSQFWSNVFLNPLDQFIKRELRCPAYLRYVDDMALFSNQKQELWEWKQAVIERLGRLRLRIHESNAQVSPVNSGIPWLGFVIYPSHRLLKARMARKGRKNLKRIGAEFASGRITFAELDASVKGWVNHLRYADTWGLRRDVLASIVTPPQPGSLG